MNGPALNRRPRQSAWQRNGLSKGCSLDLDNRPGLLAALAICASLSSGFNVVAAPVPNETLEPGTTVTHELGLHERIAYTVVLPGQRHFLVTVEQRLIDVTISVSSSERGPLLSVGNPLSGYGRESVLISTTEPDQYKVLIAAAPTAAVGGSFSLRIEELDDESRIEAEQEMTAGGRLDEDYTPIERSQAIEHYLAALAQWKSLALARERANTHAILGTLCSINEQLHEALAHYDRALSLFEALDDGFIVSYLLTDKGYAHMEFAEYDEGRAAFEHALKLARELGITYQQAVNLRNIGLTFHYPGDLDSALQWYRRSLELFDKIEAPTEQAVTLNNIGGIHYVSGDWTAAIEYFDRALEIQNAMGNKQGQATTLTNLASLYARLGEMDEALVRLRRASLIWEGLGQQREQARVLASMGSAYYGLGDLERALVFLEKALELRRKAEDRRGEAATLSQLGGLYTRLGQYDKARTHYEDALAIRQELGEPAGEAEALTGLARISIEKGESQAALDLLSEAMAILMDVGDRRAQGDLLHLEGLAYRHLDDIGAARSAFDRAVGLRNDTRNMIGVAETLYELAKLERAVGNWTVAMERTRAAIDVIEDVRTKVTSPELRASFLATQRRAYEHEIDLLMARHQTHPGGDHDWQALLASERARARSLLDVLAEAGAGLYADPDSELGRELKRLQRKLREEVARQLKLLNGPHTEGQANDAELAVQKALANLNEFEARLRRQSPRLAEIETSHIDTVGDIQALLDEDTVLLEYALGESRSFVWALTSDALESFVIADRANIENAAREMHTRLSVMDRQAANADTQHGVQLTRTLLAPAAALLGAKRLVIVPDGALHYLPFAVLPVPADANYRNGFDDVLPLIEHHEVVTLPSVTTLAVLRRDNEIRFTQGRTLAVIADPVFSRDDPRLNSMTSQSAGGPGAQRQSVVPVGIDLARLPETRNEALAIADLAPGETKLMLDFEANRGAVVDGGLREYRIVHIATHGFLNTQHPRLSGLVLSQFDREGTPVNGSIGLHDIYRLPLNAELVVLSGCDTALGQGIRGEGLVGLTSGFMYVGVPRIVASLWPVTEQSTAALMTHFYRAMLDYEMKPAEALRDAQRKLRDTPGRRWRDPYYWGAFVLQGDWRQGW